VYCICNSIHEIERYSSICCMKLLIDANLPKSLSDYFPEHEVIHTLQLPEGNLTSDKSVNAISISQECVVVTKDDDFYYTYIARLGPYKLVLVKLGNIRLKELKQYFERNASKIIELLQHNSFIILEADKIRVLE